MQVHWTLPALGDLEEIQDRIAQEGPLAAYRLIPDVMDRTDLLLADNPMVGRRGRVTGTRELVISRTPYIVVYRMNSRVEIVAVVHGKRKWPESFS